MADEYSYFFFQAEDGIRAIGVTGVQTCALPISSKNVSQAIFAYNHAGWYVQSVLLRAKLIGGIPNQLLGALTGLVQGHFPVDAPAKYADSSVVKLSKNKVKTGNAAIPIGSNPNAKGTSIYARKGSPVIAVND